MTGLPFDGAREEPVPPRRYFAPWATISCSVLVALLVGSVWLRGPASLDRLERPEASLERLVTRDMDLRDAIRRAPRWERLLYRVLLDPDEQALDDAIRWYEELAAAGAASGAELARAVLLAEAGDWNRLRAVLDASPLEGARELAWARAAYLTTPLDADAGHKALAEIRAQAPPGWFTDRLTLHLAAKVGDEATRRAAESAIARRGAALLRRQHVLVAGELLLLILGVVAVARLLARGTAPRIADALLPPPWPVGDGYGLFVRGALGVVAVGPLAGLLRVPNGALTAVMTLVAGLPLLGCACAYLVARRLPLLAPFGLAVPVARRRDLARATVALIGLSALGDAAVGWLASALGISTHWTDGFLEELLWQSPWRVAADTLDSAVWTPLVEELLFRGVLYATLRTRLGAWSAAVASAGIFAGAHGYGVVGFLSVFWSGLLWALAYERTRSLWPGILAHAADNLVATGVFLWMLRL